MPNVGIICDLSYSHSPCFRNYYYTVCNIFENVKIVSGPDDITGLDMIFIGNDHYKGHMDVWDRNTFITRCNSQGIKLVVFTAEAIRNPNFPLNGAKQYSLQRFTYLYQYVIDIDDAAIFKKKQMRGLMSVNYKGTIIPVDKMDKCVFIGKYKEPEYETRKQCIDTINKIIKVDVIDYVKTWEEYINILASYKYVLSPYSNGNFFALRFYEILLAGSIPIHQVGPNTLTHYPVEAGFDDCIYFEKVDDIGQRLIDFPYETCYNELWMEEHMLELLKGDGLV